ncbi:hypothetical protein C0J52_14717, partial [Blattella germanica]
FFRLLKQCANKYGDIFRIWVGQRPFIFIYRAEAIQPTYQESLVLCGSLKQEIGKPSFDIISYAKLCALDVVCDTAMGTNMNAQKNSQKILQRRFITPWLKPDFIFQRSLFGKRQEQCLKIIHDFTEKGHDTIATGVSWCLYVLGHHLDAQEKIVQELKRVLEDKDESWPSLKQLQKLEYLERCIKESFRLFPIVPLIARDIKQPIKILDHTLPPGVTILINAYLLHRDPRFFPNPDVFDPDRFLFNDCETRNPFAYIPFSAGPRNCIGQRFAMLELKIILSTVLSRYVIQSVDAEENLDLLGEIVLRNKGGIKLTITHRT